MSKIRIGIVGAGGRGINCFAALFSRYHRDTVQITAVADPNRVRAEAGLSCLGLTATVCSTVEEMVARKDVDAAVVTSPDYLHEEHCLAALRKKKHVLVDKPLAITGAGCLRVIAAARRADRLLYMGFNLRHDPVLKALKKLIGGGAFGDLFSLHAIEHYDGGRTYMSRWNRLKKFSGGLWIHKGSHDFDVLNWLLGGIRPVRVACFAGVAALNPAGLPFQPRKGVPVGPTCAACEYRLECPDVLGREAIAEPSPEMDEWEKQRRRMFGEEAAAQDGYQKDLCMFLSDKDTHDHGFAIVEYENGATAMHSECFVVPFSNRRYLLDGTRGYGEADLHANVIEVRPRWTHDRTVHNVYRGRGGHGGADPVMCREFVNCIRQGLRPTASGVDGAWSVAIGQAAELARAEKRAVEIAEVLDVKSRLLRV